MSFALWLMRKKNSQSATDVRLVRDLENVYFGLLRAGAHASGVPMRLVSTSEDPHGLTEFIRALSR